MKNRFAAPIPEVHYLPTIFRKIQNGELRIPAFQRGFVWQEKNMLELMESIFLGYPIGSMLFWKASAGQLKEISSDVTSFPSDEKRPSEVLYVLDGMQRISTLFGVFHKIEKKDPKFKIAYDFVEQRFFSPPEEGENLDDTAILLESLFSPRDFLAFQSVALKRADGDDIVAKSIELQSIFQEYLVPTVTINDRGVPDVVEIFSRVNSTGVKLDVVDFMRALTWSSEFDLTHEINRLIKCAEDLGFKIEGPTFVKLIAICADVEITADAMYGMSSKQAAELHEAVAKAHDLLPLAIQKLRADNRIVSSELLGYEGQFLIWAAAIKTMDLDMSADYSAIRKLVWQIGFGELLRGKPDHYLERILKKIYSEQWTNFVPDIRIGEQLFLTRRYLSGKALSSSIVSMLFDNFYNLTESAQLKSDIDFSGNLIPAFRIDRKFGETRSDKVFANLLSDICLPIEEKGFTNCTDLFKWIIGAVGKDKFNDWIRLNCLDPKKLPTTIDEFLVERATAMRAYALKLCGYSEKGNH